MKQRIITGTGYMLTLLALLLCKWFIPTVGSVEIGSLFFDILFMVVAGVGSYECLRAMGETTDWQKAFVMAFCITAIPLYISFEQIWGRGFFALWCSYGVFTSGLCLTLVFDFTHTTVTSTAKCILSMSYCGLLPCVLSVLNHIGTRENETMGILLVFTVTMLTDTFAFLFGLALGKKFPKKLAPNVSPNKTIVGGFGGIIGGMVGGMVAFFLYWLLSGFHPVLYLSGMRIHPLLFFAIVGIPISITGQIGDLFESAVKRGCGIKDMGTLLPGHGGILDRMDSALFAGVTTVLVFAFLH